MYVFGFGNSLTALTVDCARANSSSDNYNPINSCSYLPYNNFLASVPSPCYPGVVVVKDMLQEVPELVMIPQEELINLRHPVLLIIASIDTSLGAMLW